jgi:general secretion pathway protein L
MARLITSLPPAAPGHGQRLLVFVPPRRTWPAGGRNGPGAATEFDYVLLRADGPAECGAAPLARLPRARAVDLVFDALDVYSASVEAPQLGEVRLRLALPNLLEERMLADPADCHFAAGPARAAEPGAPAASQRLGVAAIDRTTFARTLEACAAAQWPLRGAYSALYTVPAPAEGVYSLRLDHGRALLRTGPDEGSLFELDDGGAALNLARRQLGIDQLRVYGDEHVDDPATEAALDALGLPWRRAGAPVDGAALADAVNLLQGAYAGAAGKGLAGRWLARWTNDGAWRAPAAWLAACALIGIAGINAYWFKLQGQFQDLRASMQHTFRDAFPNEPAVDELAQAQRDVAALRARAGRPSAGDFSVLNAQAAQLLAVAPVGVVAGIDFSPGSYTLRFAAGSVDNPGLRNTLQARAMGLGLALRFAADGSAQLAPLNGP